MGLDTTITSKISWRTTVQQGFRDALPLAIGIATYGIPYGVLATHSGFGLLSTLAMSFLVFSGSVQMVSVAMHTAGGGLVSILGTSILINLRNLLYGASLASGLAPAKKWRWLLAFGVSDEPFVLGSARFRACGPDPMYFAVVALTFYLTWILASFIGAIIGSHINTTGLGLELAFPMTFVAILMQILVDIQVISTAAAGAAIAIVIEAVSPGSPYVILIAGIISPLVGCYVRSRQKHVE